MLETVAWQTQGLCMECFVAGLGPVKEVEIAVRGGKTSFAVPQRKKRANKGRQDTRRKVEHAKNRAMRRLRFLHPETFDVLYAEERHRLGLQPVPSRERDHLVNAVATYRPPETYDAATPIPSGAVDATDPDLHVG